MFIFLAPPLTMRFVLVQLNKVCFLIYRSCDGPRREDFVDWFESLDIEIEALCLWGILIFCSSWKTYIFLEEVLMTLSSLMKSSTKKKLMKSLVTWLCSKL